MWTEGPPRQVGGAGAEPIRSVVCTAFCCSLFLTAIGLGAESSERSDQTTRAAELVREALEAEQAGDAITRQARLETAASLAPEYAPARWHLGQLRDDRHWQSLEENAAAIARSPEFAEYRARRAQLDGGVTRELALARWCEKQTMHDRALYHYARLLLHPQTPTDVQNEAVKKLDLVRFGVRWVSRSSVAELQAEAAAHDDAWKKWEAKFADWQKAVAGKSAARRQRAIESLHAIDDLHVVPLVETHLLTASDTWGRELVKLLAKMPAPPATSALTRCAVLSLQPSVRDAAIQELQRRKLHDYVPQLLCALAPHTRTQFAVWMGPGNRMQIDYHSVTEDAGSRQVNAILERHDLRRTPMPIGRTRLLQSYDPHLQELDRIDNERKTRDALARLWESEQQVAWQNRMAEWNNVPVYDVLEKTTGERLARTVAAWGDWWIKFNEVSQGKPTSYSYRNYNVPIYERTILVARCSCFVAGTPVVAESGAVPIETLRPGDRVLAQNPDTGELAWKLVQAVTVRPPSRIRRVRLGDEPIDATLGHPFWVNGIGWRMTKELQVGQRLHTLSGSRTIDALEDLPQPAPAYNLTVADFDTYFVGAAQALVHDNLYRQSTTATVPGLAPAQP